MRPRRAARPPAAPAVSARSTVAAAAHRGEDPPHDGGLAADSVPRVVIIRSPASRSRFGGLAFDDPHDVEGAHVRHDPPSPPARSGPRTAATASAPGPHVARPAARYRRWHREDRPPYWCRAGKADPDTRSGFALSDTVRRPPSLGTAPHSGTRRNGSGLVADPLRCCGDGPSCARLTISGYRADSW